MSAGGSFLCAFALTLLREYRKQPLDSNTKATNHSDYSFTQSKAFWLIASAICLSMATQIVLFRFLVPINEPRLGLEVATFIVSIAAAFAIAGRFIVGVLSRFSPEYLIAVLCYLTQAAGIVAILYFEVEAWLFFGAALAGLFV